MVSGSIILFGLIGWAIIGKLSVYIYEWLISPNESENTKAWFLLLWPFTLLAIMIVLILGRCRKMYSYKVVRFNIKQRTDANIIRSCACCGKSQTFNLCGIEPGLSDNDLIEKI